MQLVPIGSPFLILPKAISDLFKAITCLPVDATLISLPPGPLLELVVAAARNQLQSVWLSLAGMLIGQLDPPSFTTLSMGPTPEAENLVLNGLPPLLEPCFQVLNSTEAIEGVSIIFTFYSLDRILSQYYLVTRHCPIILHLHGRRHASFLPNTISHARTNIQWTNTAVCCNPWCSRTICFGSCLHIPCQPNVLRVPWFLKTDVLQSTLVRQTLADGNLSQQADALMDIHGKTIMLSLFSSLVALTPRSAWPNLIDLLALITLKRSDRSRQWSREILFSVSIIPIALLSWLITILLKDYLPENRASPEAKEHFCKLLAR